MRTCQCQHLDGKEKGRGRIKRTGIEHRKTFKEKQSKISYAPGGITAGLHQIPTEKVSVNIPKRSAPEAASEDTGLQSQVFTHLVSLTPFLKCQKGPG